MDKTLKYRKKDSYIDALKFEYSVEGIAAMTKFLGSRCGGARKERHMSAIGSIQILSLEGHPDFKVNEGMYIIKHETGHISCVNEQAFNFNFERVE